MVAISVQCTLFTPALLAASCSRGRGSCRIEGRVTLDGDPVKNAIIVLSHKGGREGFFCTTGADGTYATDVRPGVFNVSVASGKRVAKVKYQNEAGMEGPLEIVQSRRMDFMFVRRP